MTLSAPVRFVRLDPDLDPPQRAHDTDGAVDLRSREDIVLAPGERLAAATGIAVSIPAGFAGWVIPRSGLAARLGLSIVNAPGLIDADYRGEVKVLLVNLSAETITLSRGDRIAQMAIIPVALGQWEETDVLEDTVRGIGGLGSSGVA